MITRVFYFTVGFLFMMFIIKSVKKHEILEKESFFWFTGSIIIFILSIFPNIIQKISDILGIDYPPSLLFLLGMVFILLISFRLTKYVSTIKEQNKELAQTASIMEKRLKVVEYKIDGVRCEDE